IAAQPYARLQVREVLPWREASRRGCPSSIEPLCMRLKESASPPRLVETILVETIFDFIDLDEGRTPRFGDRK
ncbi:MAG TPA: hypothetical protein VGE76_18455, partial [Opitutaceae bacterium]